MSDESPVVQPRASEIAAKVIDGEAIIVNLANGIYYSLRGVGGFVWELIEARHPVTAIVDLVGARYAASPESVAADVRRLIDELLAARIVEPTETAAPADPVRPESVAQAYQPPVLEVHEDMADLLALDPPAPGLLENLLAYPTDESNES